MIASSDGVLWGLNRANFRRASAGRDMLKVLRSVSVFSSLRIDQLQDLRDAMTERRCEKDEVIVAQGEPADGMYVISQGSCSVQVVALPWTTAAAPTPLSNTIHSSAGQVPLPSPTVTHRYAHTHTRTHARTHTLLHLTRAQQVKGAGEARAVELMVLGEAQYFGEGALLDGAPRSADVVALGDVVLMRLARTDFERLLGPLQAMIDADRRARAQREERRLAALEDEGLKNVRRSTIVVQARASDGLYLCQHSSTSREYTLLVESKAAIIGREAAARTRERLAVLQVCRGAVGARYVMPTQCTRLHAPARACMRMHTRAHARTRAHTRAHARTRCPAPNTHPRPSLLCFRSDCSRSCARPSTSPRRCAPSTTRPTCTRCCAAAPCAACPSSTVTPRRLDTRCYGRRASGG